MIKKILLSAVVAVLIIWPNYALAQGGGFNNIPDETSLNETGILRQSTLNVLDRFQQETGLNSFIGGNNSNLREAGLDGISEIIYTVINILKYVAGILATIVIIISLVQLISANSDKSEEEYTKVKNHIIYSVLGVVFIILIEFFFESVFVVGSDNFLESTRTAQQFALAGTRELQGLYNFIQASIAAIAILTLVIAGFRLVSNAGEEEVVEKLKNQIKYGVFGLVLVAVSEFIVKDVIFVGEGTTFDAEAGRQLIVSFTNFISGFIALTAFISFLYAGYLYVVSGSGAFEDQSEKVKKIIIGGIIGLILAAGSFAIVNTVIRLDSTGSPSVIQDQLDTLSR